MTAIRINKLSKSYSIRRERGLRATNFGEAIVQKLRKPFKQAETEEFWALKDVNLEIEEGEAVGVIGRNGAGKSTLLKILSRVTEPTTGRIELFGRVGSLLEVGTGFHPELSGRENIFLNGAILGMRRPEIKKQFDAIIEFAGVETFLDMPVKRYSSGMYVRLAFAVAAHLNPEILIIDEVLAVGDAEFQKKCLGKMEGVAKNGKTVLFVSHNLSAVRALCKRGILLNSGTVQYAGDIEKCIDHYSTCQMELGPANQRTFLDPSLRTILRVLPLNTRVEGRSPVRIRVLLNESAIPVCCHFSLHIYNQLRENIVTISTEQLVSGMLGQDVVEFDIEITSPILLPGTYDIDVFLYAGGIIDSWQSSARFEVSTSIDNKKFSLLSNIGCEYSLTDFQLIINRQNNA